MQTNILWSRIEYGIKVFWNGATKTMQHRCTLHDLKWSKWLKCKCQDMLEDTLMIRWGIDTNLTREKYY